jgi:hypothetical protein
MGEIKFVLHHKEKKVLGIGSKKKRNTKQTVGKWEREPLK